MKIAIPYCRTRIAPLFEEAESFLLVSREFPVDRETLRLKPGLCVAGRCNALAEGGVGILLCGALSGEWERYLKTLGIEVHAFLAAEVQEVLQAYLHAGEPGIVVYAMPGCGQGICGQRRRRYRRRFCDFDSFI